MKPYKKIENFLIIIGAMKSGTSSLFCYLSEHPQIAPSSDKEPNFFSDGRVFNRGLSWYTDLWEFNPSVHQYALEGSTNYTKAQFFPEVTERMASTNANFKFLYIIRNPYERIESHYTHCKVMGIPLGDKVSADKVHPGLLDTSKYAMQLEAYRERFSTDAIMLLDFEELRDNPQQLLSKVCRFLGIDDTFKFTDKGPRNKSEGKVVYGPLWQSIKPVANALPTQFFLSKDQRNTLRSFFGRRIKSTYQLSSAQRQFVHEELKDDLTKLQTVYGFDVSKWNINL